MRLSAVGLYRWLRQDEYIEFAREAGTVHKDADRHRARILWNLVRSGRDPGQQRQAEGRLDGAPLVELEAALGARGRRRRRP
jgi:hypothetical protein